VFGVVLLAGSILFEKKRRKIRDSFNENEITTQTDD
jgi:hypothetical protein